MYSIHSSERGKVKQKLGGVYAHQLLCYVATCTSVLYTHVHVPATGYLADLLPSQGVHSSGNTDIPGIVVTKLTVTIGTKREDTTILRREGEGEREREGGRDGGRDGERQKR